MNEGLGFRPKPKGGDPEGFGHSRALQSCNLVFIVCLKMYRRFVTKASYPRLLRQNLVCLEILDYLN